jgi:phospholipid/cholesterol/gamma-HCH transport system substrate-binding protein
MTIRRRIRIRAAVLVAFALACLGIFLFLLQLAGGLSVGAKYDFEAVVPTSVQLVPGADVREAGVAVGKVTDISNRGATAVVAISIDKSRGPVYRDGAVRIRTKTIVGETYVELTPGTPAAGAIREGGVLPITQAQDAVQLDQILSTLDPARRRRLQELLQGFGGGLRGASASLNQTLDALSGTVDHAGPVAQALAAQSEQLGSLVGDLGQVFSALGDRAAAIRRLATAGLATATAVADQGAALRQALRELPATVIQARDTTAHLAAVGTAASPVLDQLTTALGDLTPALRALPAAGAATVSALRRLHAATPVAGRLLDALSTASPPGAAVIPPLGELLRELRPAVAYLAPYATDAAHLLNMLHSAGLGQDATGYLARIVGVLGSASLVTLTPPQKQALQALQLVGAAQLLNLKGPNAYPAPGTAASPSELTHAYPHINADTGH